MTVAKEKHMYGNDENYTPTPSPQCLEVEVKTHQYTTEQASPSYLQWESWPIIYFILLLYITGLWQQNAPAFIEQLWPELNDSHLTPVLQSLHWWPTSNFQAGWVQNPLSQSHVPVRACVYRNIFHLTLLPVLPAPHPCPDWAWSLESVTTPTKKHSGAKSPPLFKSIGCLRHASETWKTHDPLFS